MLINIIYRSNPLFETRVGTQNQLRVMHLLSVWLDWVNYELVLFFHN